jgi:hypothetical protein
MELANQNEENAEICDIEDTRQLEKSKSSFNPVDISDILKKCTESERFEREKVPVFGTEDLSFMNKFRSSKEKLKQESESFQPNDINFEESRNIYAPSSPPLKRGVYRSNVNRKMIPIKEEYTSDLEEEFEDFNLDKTNQDNNRKSLTECPCTEKIGSLEVIHLQISFSKSDILIRKE